MSSEHEPGCLGHHFGDCAVSGFFEQLDAPSLLTALRALLLYPPAGASDAEVLAAARSILRLSS